MRFAIFLLFLLAPAVEAWTYPHPVFLGLPAAATLGDPGRASVEVIFSPAGATLGLGLALGARIDLFATVETPGGFSWGVRALVIQDLGPLEVALGLATRGVDFAAGLHLGPVRVEWGRTFAQGGWRGAVLALSPLDRLSLLVGVEDEGGRTSFIALLRLFSWEGRWWASASLRRRALVLGAGGTL